MVVRQATIPENIFIKSSCFPQVSRFRVDNFTIRVWGWVGSCCAPPPPPNLDPPLGVVSLYIECMQLHPCKIYILLYKSNR